MCEPPAPPPVLPHPVPDNPSWPPTGPTPTFLSCHIFFVGHHVALSCTPPRGPKGRGVAHRQRGGCISILRGFVYLNRVTMAPMATMVTMVTMLTMVTTVTMVTMVTKVAMVTIVHGVLLLL